MAYVTSPPPEILLKKQNTFKERQIIVAGKALCFESLSYNIYRNGGPLTLNCTSAGVSFPGSAGVSFGAATGGVPSSGQLNAISYLLNGVTVIDCDTNYVVLWDGSKKIGVCWGSATNSGVYASVSFPLTFSSVPKVLATVNDPNTWIAAVDLKSTTGCRVYTNASPVDIDYIAIGEL